MKDTTTFSKQRLLVWKLAVAGEKEMALALYLEHTAKITRRKATVGCVAHGLLFIPE